MALWQHGFLKTWQAWHFVEIRATVPPEKRGRRGRSCTSDFFKMIAKLSKTLSGVAHRASRSSCSFYLTFPEVRESLSGVVHRAHRLLSRCEYYRIASAKRVAGVVLWRSPCSPVSICDCKLRGRRGTSCTFATFKMRVLSYCDC